LPSLEDLPDEFILSVGEAAELLGISRPQLYCYVAAKQIGCIRYPSRSGRHERLVIKLRMRHIRDFWDGNERKPPPAAPVKRPKPRPTMPALSHLS
jgi:excisionase family DNA binding protein